MWSSGILIGPGGIRFGLVDAYHRRQDYAGVALHLWLACVLVGVVGSVVALVVDVLTKETYQMRLALCLAAPNLATRILVWVSTGAIAALGATMLVKWEPSASGSGLPEVKEAMSGILLFDSLSLKTLLVKPIALALALSSSLSIGKEGPFVHCACCIAYQVANSRYVGFSKLVKDQRQIELLVAACAIGVVFTFGAPVGGVLFSAEITSTGLYSLEHLPRAFFSVTISLTLYYIGLRPLLIILLGDDPFTLFTTTFFQHSFSTVELLAFALQGVLAALVAAACEKCVKGASKLRPYLKGRWGMGYALPALIAVGCSLFNLGVSGGACKGHYTEGGGGTLDRLFNMPGRGASVEEALAADNEQTWLSLTQLFAFGAFKLLLLSPISLAMPVPTGVFLPTFVSGAALGSLYGSLLRRLAPALFGDSLPGHFAVTGAAALASAATRTMSSAVVTIELSGQLFLQIPVLVASTTAYLAARLLETPSLFDSFVTIKGLPGATDKGVPLAADGPLSTSSLALRDFAHELTSASVPRFINARELVVLLTAESTRWALDGVTLVPIV